MAMIYRQVVTGAMASGATVVVSHALGTVPHYISPNCVTSVAVVGATASTITFRNDGPATNSVTFMLAYKTGVFIEKENCRITGYCIARRQTFVLISVYLNTDKLFCEFLYSPIA